MNTTSKTITLAEIARTMKLNPRAVRARARRSDLLNTLAINAWTFAKKDQAKVVAFLKS